MQKPLAMNEVMEAIVAANSCSTVTARSEARGWIGQAGPELLLAM